MPGEWLLTLLFVDLPLRADGVFSGAMLVSGRVHFEYHSVSERVVYIFKNPPMMWNTCSSNFCCSAIFKRSFLGF